MSEPVLTIEGLSFGYPDQPLFVDWSAEVSPGVTWVRGGDGSGKSSLLRLIAGELQGAGIFRIGGVRLETGTAGRRGKVAWCDPRNEALDAVTALAWFDRLQADQPAFDAALLQRHIDGFGLLPHLAKPAYQLSTGSRRKVWLAGSLASGAPVTLLDQPQAALDEPSRNHLMRALADCSAHRSRAWIVAEPEWPERLDLAGVIELPDRI